jgi:hypothetical protein
MALKLLACSWLTWVLWPGRAAVRAALAVPDEREQGLVVCALIDACSLEDAFGEQNWNFYPHACIAEVRRVPGRDQQHAAPSHPEQSIIWAVCKHHFRNTGNVCLA